MIFSFLVSTKIKVLLFLRDGETPLHSAIRLGEMQIAQILLSNKADPALESNIGCCYQYCTKYNQQEFLSQMPGKILTCLFFFPMGHCL
jgi:ankyrin repeat protein